MFQYFVLALLTNLLANAHLAPLNDTPVPRFATYYHKNDVRFCDTGMPTEPSSVSPTRREFQYFVC